MHAIGEGAFRESDQRLVDAVRALAITARYLSGLEHAGDRAILTTDVEIETIKRRAAEVAKEARAHDSEPLAVLADQLSALATGSTRSRWSRSLSRPTFVTAAASTKSILYPSING